MTRDDRGLLAARLEAAELPELGRLLRASPLPACAELHALLVALVEIAEQRQALRGAVRAAGRLLVDIEPAPEARDDLGPEIAHVVARLRVALGDA